MSSLKSHQFLTTQLTNYKLQVFQESVLSLPWGMPIKIKSAVKNTRKEKQITQLIEFLQEASNYITVHGMPHDAEMICHMWVLFEFLKTYLFTACIPSPLIDIIFNLGNSLLKIENCKSISTYRQRPIISSCPETLENEAIDFNYTSASFEEEFLSKIPEKIVICSLNFDLMYGDLYVTRMESDKQCVFKLPLKRLQTRQGEKDGLDFATADETFLKIMEDNKISTQEAKKCVTPELRRTWLSGRKILDKKLQDLLTQIESCWLSGFKVLLFD
jgi:hypothetical protein